jgi:hypothetical protein
MIDGKQAVVGRGRRVMAKGQLRSHKEAKKPKKDKALKSAPAGAPAAGAFTKQGPLAGSSGKKK